jgi:L-threonylcarbamoyladenylate synthase
MPVETQLISIDDRSWLETALVALRGGGLVAFPTDTVYGLGALAFDGKAIEAIYLAKRRSTQKSIPILVAGWEDAMQVSSPPAAAGRLASAFWPGALTLIVTREASVPSAIGPGGTVGVRAPDHKVAMELLRSAGPLATSSANRSGEASARTVAEVAKALGGRIAVILDGGDCPGGRPSTVVDLTGESPVLLRRGPVPFEEVLRVWSGRS